MGWLIQGSHFHFFFHLFFLKLKLHVIFSFLLYSIFFKLFGLVFFFLPFFWFEFFSLPNLLLFQFPLAVNKGTMATLVAFPITIITINITITIQSTQIVPLVAQLRTVWHPWWVLVLAMEPVPSPPCRGHTL